MTQTLPEKIQIAAAKLEQVANLRILGQTDQWKHMRRALSGVVHLRTKRLCEEDCAEPETRTIRAELRAYAWFLRAGEAEESTVAQLRKELEGLQANLARRHDYGLTDGNPETGNLMQQIDMLLHRTENL